MKRVLIANIFGLGDVLFTTPLVASLKKAYPGLKVDYLANARTKDMVSCVPGVDKVFVYEKDDLAKIWKASKVSALKETWRLFSGIRGNRYDAVFDLTLSRKFGLLFLLAGIPKRVGLDYKKRGTFLTDKVELKAFSGKHVAEHYLDLLRRIGIEPSVRDMSLAAPEELDKWAGEYLRGTGLDPAKLAVVIPGGGASWGPHSYRKRWRPESFAAAAAALARNGWDILVLGDTSEQSLCAKVAEKAGGGRIKTENGLDIKRYISLLSRSRLILCNDGGPLHVAAALGLKTVSIFGPVDPEVYGPYPLSARHRVITAEGVGCRPCYNRFRLPRCEYDMQCLESIKPEVVAEACLELLKKG